MNMTDPRETPKSKLIEAYLDELLALPDEEVLRGRDPAEIQAGGLRLFAKAKQEAGRRRLAAAKASVAQSRQHSQVLPSTSVTAEAARRFLAAAANDTRFTLAARELQDMSDEDVLRAYAQMQQLLTGSGHGDGEA